MELCYPPPLESCIDNRKKQSVVTISEEVEQSDLDASAGTGFVDQTDLDSVKFVGVIPRGQLDSSAFDRVVVAKGRLDSRPSLRYLSPRLKQSSEPFTRNDS